MSFFGCCMSISISKNGKADTITYTLSGSNEGTKMLFIKCEIQSWYQGRPQNVMYTLT